MGIDASGVRDDGPWGGGGDGRDPQSNRDERLGRPGGVRRPEPRTAAHARPQRRLRRKPSVEGGDHEWPDLALEAGAGLTAAGRNAEDVVWRGTTPAAGVSVVLIQRTPSVFDEQVGYNKGRHSRMAMLHPLER